MLPISSFYTYFRALQCMFIYLSVSPCSTIRRLTPFIVLPPVDTKNLRAEDTNDLVLRVRSQMLETLREISVKSPPLEGPTTSPATQKGALEVDSKTPVVVEDIPAMEAKPVPSSGKAREGSDNGTETEEEEGMVLVGRPS